MDPISSHPPVGPPTRHRSAKPVVVVLLALVAAVLLLARRADDPRLVFAHRTAGMDPWNGGCRGASPVATASTLHLCGGRSGKDAGRLIAVDPRTRSVRWERGPIEGCGALVAVADTLYAWDGRAVTAFDAEGHVRWRRADLAGRPFAVAGRLYVGLADPPALAVLDPLTLALRGAIAVPELPSAPPLVEGETVRFGTLGGRVVTLDLRTGTATATRPADRVDGPLVRAGDLLVFHARRPEGFALVGYDAASDAVRWTAPTGVLSQSAPVVVGDEVFFGADRLYAVRTDTGASRSIELSGGPVGNVVVHEGTLYAAGGRYMHAVEPGTGAIRWRFAAGDWIDAPPTGGAPVLRDGVLYFGSLDCHVYGLRVGGETP